MFTGIIEEVGEIINFTHFTDISNVAIRVSNEFGKNSKIGDSISINGTCLTITEIFKYKEDKPNIDFVFKFGIVKETIEKTNLEYIDIGNQVNLERAMKADSRFDGHIVQGHIEGVGKVKKIQKDNNSFIVSIEIPENLSNYCIHKGSIAVNGVSLTIASIKENLIDIWIIPHTLNHTTFGIIKENDFVNIETDLIAKYVEKFQTYNN